MIWKVSKHIWTMLLHKILQTHLLCAFVASLKIDTTYVLYLESFCDKNLAVRKVFAFSDSAPPPLQRKLVFNMERKIEIMSAPLPRKNVSAL